jgi:Dolichyl-phosphate-mannose-protein mannosyltransferase
VRRLDPAVALALILAIYLALGVATMLTRAPWQDEAWFGSPAYNLAYRGFLGTTILDPASSTWKKVDLTGIDRHTYWVMPLSLLLNAADFRLFGFGSLQMRMPALLFGLTVLLAWWAILRRLGAPDSVRIAAVLLIAVDYHFQMQAADGRMDAMTVGLGYAALASYLILRDRGLTKAVAVSQALAAAAFFTHPNGALLVLLLVCTTLYLDRGKLRLRLLPVAAIPYIVIGAGWGVYIAQDPAAFRAQFFGNAAGRGPTITAPIEALYQEITHRYMASFGLAEWSSLSGRLNVVPLLILLAGVAACFAIGGIRKHPGYRLILIWTAITVAYLTWFEGLKTHFYLIYLTPLYSVLTAIAAHWLWNWRPRWRLAVAAALAVLVVLQATRIAVIARRNPRATAFLPAVRYLAQHFDKRTFIMGNGALMFGLGPDWKVLDDFRLGYNSGKKADVIIIDESWEDRIGMLKEEHPEIWQYTQRVLGSYREVYNEAGYRILVAANPS